MPSLRYERELFARGFTRVVGVDEVGMASLAGPVVAAAVVVTPEVKLIRRVRDSKLLTRKEREELVPVIRARASRVGVGAASVAEIDRLNIYNAPPAAMQRARRSFGAFHYVLDH